MDLFRSLWPPPLGQGENSVQFETTQSLLQGYLTLFDARDETETKHLTVSVVVATTMGAVAAPVLVPSHTWSSVVAAESIQGSLLARQQYNT